MDKNIYLDFLRQLGENGSATDTNEQKKDTEQQTEQQTNTNNQADAPAVTEVREDMDKAFDNTNAFEQYVQELQNRTKYNDASNEKLLGVVSDVAKGNKPYYHLSMQGQQDAYEAQKELNKRLASGDIAYDVQPKKEVAKNKSGYYIYDPENEHNEFLNLSDQQLSAKMKDVKAKLDAMSGTEDDYADTFKIAEKLNEAITYRNEGHKSNDPVLRAAIEKENKRRQEQQKAQQQKAIESTDSYKLNLWIKQHLSENDENDTIYNSTGYNLGAQAAYGLSQQEKIQIAYAYTQDKSHSLADKKNFVRGVFSGTQEKGADPGIPRYLGENMLRANIKNAKTEEEKSDSTKVYDEYVKIVKAESPGKKNSYVNKMENEALAKFIASYQKASADNAKLAEENYNKSFGFLRDGEDIEMANLKRASQYLTGVDIAGLIRQAWDSMDPNTMRASAVRLAESRGEMTEQGIQKAQNEIVDTFYKDCIKYVKDDIPEGAFGVIQNAFANSIAGNFWQGAIRGGNVNNNELTLLDLYQQRLQEQDQNYAKNGWSGAANLITSKAFQMGFDTPFFGGIGRVASTATKPLLKPFVSLAVGKLVPKAVYNSAFNAFASTGGGRLVVGVTSGAITGSLFNPISMAAQSYATGQSASFGEYLSGAAKGAFDFGAMGFTPMIGNYMSKNINKVFSGTGKAQTIVRTMSNVVVQDVISPGINAAIVTGLENWREIVKHGISPDLVTEYARTYGEFIGMHLGGKVSHLGKGKLVNNLKAMYGYKTALQQQGFTKSELEAINNSEAVANIKRIINESATIGDAEMKQIAELHKDIIADNTIPEGAKLKLFAIVGDSAIATPTITNVERVEEGGKHVVKVYTAEGKLFSANEFSSKSQADNEVKRISNITEKNKILATQSTFDAVWFQQVTNDATRALAETKGVDVTEMSKQLGDIAERSKSGAEISIEDKALLKEFDDAIKAAVNNTTLQNSEQLKNSYKNVGVSIDVILSKDYSQWTKSDKELVERYVDTMNSAIAKDNERKNAMIRRREVASIIKQSFDEGNSLEDAQSINDTALRVNALENSLGDYLTDELRIEIMNDPVSAYERVVNDENLSAPVKERILEYITTRAKFDGFVSSVNERIYTEIEASNTAIDAITHKSEGNVIEVELTDNAGIEKGKKVYVVNGKLSTNGNSFVDLENSDKTIAIIVEGDEKPRMISPSKIVRVVNNSSAEELKNSAREEIVARISAESNNAVNGTINSVAIGDKISISNDEGNVVEAEVVQPTDKEGNPIAPKDGEVFIKVGEDIFSISLEQLSIRAGNAKYDAISNEYGIEADPTSEDGIRVDLAKDEAEENVAPEADKATDEENIHIQAYKPGQFTLREGGEDKLAIVTGNVDEQGRIQYLVQGENEFRYATNDEMRELAKDYKPYEEAEEGNTMPEAEAKEVVNAEQREAENEAEAVEQKVADEFPVDENGKKDYVSAGAERTAKHIYEELELEKENADELVENNIASANEELAKAEKAKEEALKGVTDPDEMAALQKSANEAVAKAKQKKELWEAVKDERAKQNEENEETPSLTDASESVKEAESKLRKLNDEYAEADKVLENKDFHPDKEYWDNMRRIDDKIEGELKKLGDDDLSEIAKNFGGQVGNRAERILHKRKVDSLTKLSDEDLLQIVDEKGELWEEARDILDGKEAAKSDVQRYNELLEEQGEISGNAKKNYSLNKYIDKKGRPQLRGVYHKDGYAIATDTHVLVADKRKYDKANDGRIIDKDGNEIEGGFPNAFAVVPRRIISSDIDAMDLLNFIAGVKEIVKSKKEKLKDKVILLNFGGELWAGNAENFEKFANAAVSLGGKIYFNDNAGTGIYTRPIYTESDKGFAIMMPVDYTRNSIDKENYFAYKPAELGSETESMVGKDKHQLGEGGELRMAQELTEKSRNDMQTVARSLGVELVFDESLKENGRYTTIDQKTGKPTIHVAMNASNPLESVFGHEATHRVKSLDNESYSELHDVARLMIGDEEFFDRANQKKELYAKNGITLTDADAREEVVSDYIGSLIYDKEHMGKVADKLSKPILSKIRDVVSDFLDYFRRNKMTADERLAKGSLRAIDRAFANAANSVLNYADGTKYSLVEDKAEIDRLNKEEVEIGYQNIELKDDLSVGSPMASKLKSKGKGRVATGDSQFGQWGRSEENPDLVDENGKIDLVKPDGKTVDKVDYNPYFHIRPYLFNKQFKQAWERPRLVFIETQFPKSELSSGFKADKAKLSVGRHNWNGGELILSRWTKPKAIVPWREVAPHWIEEFKDSGVYFDIVPPALLNTMRDNGVKILPPHKGMGKNCFDAYEEFKKGNYNPEFITDEQIDAFNEKINSDNTQSEKFSIRANDELEKKSLVGIHNLTDDNLRYAIKLGGLANPSTAVVDTDIMGLEGFGDISMIMPKSLVDKRTGKNVGTYAGDAYTPRFPKGDIVKHISSKGFEKINQDYQGNDQFSRDFREALRSYGSEYGGITPTLYYLYKLENGGADVVKHEGPKIKSEAHRMMIDKYGEKEWSELSDADKQELVEYRREEIRESLKDVEKSKADKLVDKLINSSDFDTLAYKKFRSLKMDYNEQKNAGDIDYQGTYNKAQNDVIMSGEHDKFAKWIDEKSIRYGIEDRIFRGYTPSGNRKYAPLTLSNISKVMKESGRAGSEAMMSGSPHSLRGKMLPLYKTLESIKKNNGILSDKETYERIRGEIENEYNELISIISDIKGVDYNDAYYVLEDALLRGFNYAEREAGITIDSETKERISAFGKLLKESPVKYFETKFERPVMLNEFVAAVVPKDIDAELKKSLIDNGIAIEEYERGNEESRLEAVKRASNREDVKFSIREGVSEREAELRDAFRRKNPEDWKNVVELMKDTAIWEDVKNRYQELETDNEIADEVLALYSGSRGAERLRAEQEKLISSGESPLEKATAVSAIASVKDALNRFWRGVANFLGIRYTNAEQVADKVLSDLLNGVNPNSKIPVTKYQIIGEKGAEALDKAQEATIRMDNLSVAREMEKSGKDAKAIRLATGWERGADGKWRYEIPDEINISDDGQVLRNAINIIRLERLSEKLGITTDALKTEIYNLKAEIERRRQISNLEEQLQGIENGDVSEDNKLEASKIRKQIEFYKSRLRYENSIDVEKKLSDLENSFDDVNELMLTDVFGKDNSLFKAYPELADIVVKFDDKGYTSVLASVSDDGKEMWINPNSWVSQSSLFLHEVQHAIQKIEGFSQGGYSGLFQIPKEHKYANLPGKEISKMRDGAEFARQELSKYNSYEELKDYYISNRSVLAESKRNALVDVLDAVYNGDSVEDAISLLEKEYQQAMVDLKWNLTSNDSPYIKYQRLAGEVESRNVQARMNMTDQERREKLLADTEDVARKDQIFLFENGLAHRENDFDEGAKYSIRDDGSTIEGAEEAKPVTLRSILSDRNIGLKEQITLSKALLAEQNKSDKTLLNDFVRSVTDNLSDVRKAMSAQKVYDQATVKRVADLARIMLSTGHLSNLGKGEQQRLLSAIKNSAGANNNDKMVQKIMDIMVSNQLKNGELALEALERKKGTRLDSTRVQHVGELDPAGNIMLDAFKTCRKMSDEKLSEQIGEYLSKMDSNDEAIADNASNAYAGAMIARMYHEKIRTSIEDEKTLRDSLDDAENDKELRKNNPETYHQLVDSINDAITQNRIDRAQAYYDLVGMLTNKMKDSAENAKQFKESEKQRVKNIHHIANSDMQGRKLRGDRKDNTLEGINNFPVFRFLASPLANLDQMLRMLGGKNSYGRGYLWNHFMRGWADSADKEQVATEKYYDMLDKKAAEIFGEKGYVFNGNPVKRAYRYTDLYSYAEDLPKATISYLDGGEMREYALSQAELLYLYAVEKMPLGRATNRKMGISEDVMEQITNVLDEKLKRFADWTQEELLPSLGNEMNAVHRRMFGANMDSIENYFPFVRDKKAIKVEVENGNLQNFNDKISVKTGAIKKRTANVIKWDMPNCNFFKVLAKHVDEGCHWMGFAEINKDFSTLLSYNRFKQQVMNINSVYGNGSTLWKTFANVCAIATDAYEPQRSESDELMVRIAKNVTLSKIAFNPMPAIKQLLSLPAFFGEVKPQYVMQSLLRGGVADVKWAWENLPNYRKRVKSRMIGDYYLRDSEFEKKGGIVGLLQTAGDKFESFAKRGMIPNIGIDAWTIAVGAYGAYRTAKDKYIRWGMSEEKAEERAKQDATLCYNKSQQSSEGPFMSKVQIDHTFFSTMMMLFRNAATSYTRETHASLRNLKRLVSGEVDYEYMAKQILRQAEIPTFSKIFDSELNRQAEGTLANDHDYSLGTPGEKLQSAGIQDKPIKLFPELLSSVAEQNGLEVKYFSGLVDAINKPVAVLNEEGQTRIVVETDGGNDHCIVDIQPNEEGYRVTNIELLSNHPNGYYMLAKSLLDFTAPRYINQGKAKRMLKMSGVLTEFNEEDAEAISNIANNFVNPMVPEQQNLSGWRKEDIDNAKKQAKREIVGSTSKNIVNTAIFGLVLPWAWRIGGAASLLLLSDDDDAKQEVIDDANRKAVTSGLEGIAYGDVVTDGLHVLWDRFVNGNKDAKLAYLGRNNPFYSDMSTMLRHMDRDVMQGCADIINIFISSLTGVNPQLVSNWTAAWMDKASGNRELSNEWGLFAARLVNTPKSQLENIYFEEVGLMGSEVSNYTPEQLAMRFANYQVRRGYSIIPSSCVGDSAFTKQKNYAFKIIKEKMNNSIDKDTQQKYEQFSASINEGKKKVGEAKNKFIDGVIDGAQLYASLRYSKDYDIYRKYAKYDAELTKVVNLYLNCESTKEAKFLINSIRDIRRNLVESYDATLSGDTDKENASATKLDESVSKFWDDYYEMNQKALEKEQRKREVNKAL